MIGKRRRRLGFRQSIAGRMRKRATIYQTRWEKVQANEMMMGILTEGLSTAGGAFAAVGDGEKLRQRSELEGISATAVKE